MADQPQPVRIVGSERPARPGARPVGAQPPDEQVEVTVYLRPRPPAGPAPARLLTHEELAVRRGAAPADLAAVESHAGRHVLEVLEVDSAGRRVRLRGAASAIGAAFGIELQRYEHPGGPYRSYEGQLALPPELAGVVVAVLGLDDRPAAGTRLRPAVAPLQPLTPLQVASAYGVAAGASASGVCIAIVELGGGYVEADLAAYFAGLGLPLPAVESVAVDGGSNQPSGSVGSADGEVMLDIEVCGAVAPGASIAVYFAPNTDQGFADAISAAVHDATRRPAVVSISWGGPEDGYAASAITAFENAFTDAALVGTTVFVAAGDSGSSDGASDGLAHVDYPASSPQVVGCGGTRLELSGGSISAETVWNDGPGGGATGGGVSSRFPLPAWQNGAGVPLSANPGGGPGRGVPDVAGDADPDTGYRVRVDGADTVVGGTSAVAPLYSALAALAVARGGHPLGFVNPVLYAGGGDFRDITQGSNGAYSAGPGWDPCTGLGSPRVAALIPTLAAAAPAPAAAPTPAPAAAPTPAPAAAPTPAPAAAPTPAPAAAPTPAPAPGS